MHSPVGRRDEEDQRGRLAPAARGAPRRTGTVQRRLLHGVRAGGASSGRVPQQRGGAVSKPRVILSTTMCHVVARFTVHVLRIIHVVATLSAILSLCFAAQRTVVLALLLTTSWQGCSTTAARPPTLLPREFAAGLSPLPRAMLQEIREGCLALLTALEEQQAAGLVLREGFYVSKTWVG